MAPMACLGDVRLWLKKQSEIWVVREGNPYKQWRWCNQNAVSVCQRYFPTTFLVFVRCQSCLCGHRDDLDHDCGWPAFWIATRSWWQVKKKHSFGPGFQFPKDVNLTKPVANSNWTNSSSNPDPLKKRRRHCIRWCRPARPWKVRR